MKGLTVACALALATGAAVAETGVIARTTDLLAQAQADAAKLATLNENTKVDLLRRVGAWSEVKASGQTGWVRMMNLKLDGSGQAAPASASGGGNALANLLSSGRTTNSATSTTGVRGLTEEDLQKAEPNPEELKKMQKFRMDKGAGQAFAQRNKFAPVTVEYLQDIAPANNGGEQTPAGMGG